MSTSCNNACYAAIDIGASSGRVVVGWLNDANKMELVEVHRFDNIQKHLDGHDCWDIEMLFEEAVAGLAAARVAGFTPKSVGIDTWGVDFVLLDADGKLIGNAVALSTARSAPRRPRAAC